MSYQDNPFYHNYLFSKEDINRAIIKWWQYPLLWLLPTYIQITEGYVWKFKTWGGAIYYMGYEELPTSFRQSSLKGEK